MKKLELKNLKIKSISKDEQATVKGGFLSIGHDCSVRMSCPRLVAASNQYCSRAVICLNQP
jgi:hypothetical protein